MRHVIDASVAAKWFIPEDHSELALRLLEGNEEFYAPDLLYAEFGNILWKKQRRGELLREHAAKAIAGLHAVPLRVHPSKSLLDLAMDIAARWTAASMTACIYRWSSRRIALWSPLIAGYITVCRAPRYRHA